MKLLRGSVAALAASSAILALVASPAPAAPSLVNPGFESGTTVGWQGTGSVSQSYAGFTAPAGTYFGLVRSPGCPGEELEQRFTASEGDVVSGWAFFSTGDTLPFDDHGAVEIEIEQTGTGVVVFGARVSDVGDGGATPWTSFAYTIPQAGGYSIRARVENALDCGEESAVGIDMAQVSLDADGDGILDEVDVCPGVADADQHNLDGDAQGDACDADDDNDGFDDAADNCPQRANSAQADTDGDGQGNACDADDDNDAVADVSDNCGLVANADQADVDGDGRGDPCDSDDDNDGVADSVDNCPLLANTDQSDNDADHHGDPCDSDDDNDGVTDSVDNCPLVANPAQRDDDLDGVGNSCDATFDPIDGKAAGGGWIAVDGDKLHFSVSAMSRHGVVDGTCSMTLRRTKVKCLRIDGYHRDPEDNHVALTGTVSVDGASTPFALVLRDSGHDDRFRMTTGSGFAASGDLGAGNIQVRAR